MAGSVIARAGTDMPRILPKTASNPPPTEVTVSGDRSGPADESGPMSVPLSAAWITDELLKNTRRVWSKAYRRPIDDREATEILMNVKRFAEVLLKAARSEHKP